MSEDFSGTFFFLLDKFKANIIPWDNDHLRIKTEKQLNSIQRTDK